MSKNEMKAMAWVCFMVSVLGAVSCTMHRDQVRSKVKIECIKSGGYMDWRNQCEFDHEQ